MPQSSLSIGYTCAWEINRARTWSGIPASLEQAFAKHDAVRLCDIDCALPSWATALHKARGIRFRGGERVSTYRFQPSYVQALARLAEKKTTALPQKPDAALQIGDLSLLAEIPFFTYQDLTVHYLLEYWEQTGKPLWMFSQYTKQEIMRRWEYQQRYYEGCAGVFTMSNWLRTYLIEKRIAPAHKVHTVHAGTNVPISPNTALSLPSENRLRTILFVGRDFERKGGDVVVAAFKRVWREYAGKVRLVIAGPPTWEACATGTSTVPDGIEFLGDAPYSTLQRYFAEADVFCMPSRFEAFGIVFVEALGYGVPCIGRDAYAMPEIIQHNHNGYLLEHHLEGDAAAVRLAELLTAALQNDKMRESVWQEREKQAAYYSWERVAQDMLRGMRLGL